MCIPFRVRFRLSCHVLLVIFINPFRLCNNTMCVVHAGRISTALHLMQSMLLLLQPETKRSLLTARLFPVAHPVALIGSVEVLWLAGILTDTSGATLDRCGMHCLLSSYIAQYLFVTV